MNKVLVTVAALLLSGCVSTPQFITKEKLTVVEPDSSFYNCPGVGKYPNPDTLTDVQVGRLLLNYEKANGECRRNMNAIKTFIQNAKARSGENAAK